MTIELEMAEREECVKMGWMPDITPTRFPSNLVQDVYFEVGFFRTLDGDTKRKAQVYKILVAGRRTSEEAINMAIAEGTNLFIKDYPGEYVI